MINDITNIILKSITETARNNKNYLEGAFPNRYVFNHSMIPLKNNLYMVTYRYCKYRFLNNAIEIHPWKMWFDGPRLLQKHLGTFDEKKYKIDPYIDPKDYVAFRYRSKPEPDMFLSQPDDDLMDFVENAFEYDSTGLCILKWDDDIEIITNYCPIFRDDNQDARLQIVDGEIFMTYNGFVDNNGYKTTRMFYRHIIYDDEVIYMGVENELLGSNAQKIEKNCVFDGQDILYSINGEFQIIQPSGMKKVEVPIIKSLINYYGSENIIFSLSTPVVNSPYGKMIIGHVKLNFRLPHVPDSPASYFFSNINLDEIRKSGKHIYMMFVVAFDDDYNVKYLSPAFIPTDYHRKSFIPFLLTFPSGLIYEKGRYIINYGEGDMKCMNLVLTEKEMGNLLKSVDLLSPKQYQFGFYDSERLQFRTGPSRILVLGYYYQFNTGDDGFMVIFEYIRKTYSPDVVWDYYECSKFKFENLHKYSLVIAGGGDIINPYFMDKIKTIKDMVPIKIIGVSVGIPYVSCIEKYGNLFDEVFLRNPKDVTVFSAICSDVKVSYIPDICFGLSLAYDSLKTYDQFDNGMVNVGVFLARPYFHEKHEKSYINMVKKLAKSLDNVVSTYPNMKLWLIPFGVKKTGHHENDNIINNHIKKMMEKDISIVDVSTTDNVYEVFSIISKLDYSICSRFHAHVFSMCHAVPFMSIASTRKCNQMLEYYNFSETRCELKLNDINVPVDFDVDEFAKKFKYVVDNADALRLQMNKLINTNLRELGITFDYLKNMLI